MCIWHSYLLVFYRKHEISVKINPKNLDNFDDMHSPTHKKWHVVGCNESVIRNKIPNKILFVVARKKEIINQIYYIYIYMGQRSSEYQELISMFPIMSSIAQDTRI